MGNEHIAHGSTFEYNVQADKSFRLQDFLRFGDGNQFRVPRHIAALGNQVGGFNDDAFALANERGKWKFFPCCPDGRQSNAMLHHRGIERQIIRFK
jgi:hypothetical protein